MIGRMHHVLIDCPDPLRLAAFYAELFGSEITHRSDDHREPRWLDPDAPQQFHLDVMVEDVVDAGLRVLALGATKLPGDDVYADPAGHPFCLIRRPGWVEPIP